jgi:hypothetical protein
VYHAKCPFPYRFILTPIDEANLDPGLVTALKMLCMVVEKMYDDARRVRFSF